MPLRCFGLVYIYGFDWPARGLVEWSDLLPFNMLVLLKENIIKQIKNWVNFNTFLHVRGQGAFAWLVACREAGS